MFTTLLCVAVMLSQPRGLVKVVCPRCHTIYYRGETVQVSRLSRLAYRSASRCGYRFSRRDLAPMEAILRKESRGRTTARNRRSGAYGMWQFKDATWRAVGIPKTDCPQCQTEAFLRYIQLTKRYGTISRAWAYHQEHGHY